MFHCSTEIIFGNGSVRWLEGRNAHSVLVVTDRFFEENGAAARIGALVPGAQVTIFSQVTPDPPAEVVAKGVALCRQCQPDLVIALGGGSPMDCAKAVGYLLERRPVFAAIPTTSGTGSEVTSFSIVTHNGKKHPIVDEALRPDYAILDPELLTDLPKGLIADAGMDVLSHDLEAAAAKDASPFTDALARESFARCMAYLPASFSGDRSARGPVHLAATMAGMAFDQAGLGICHALAHALGGRFHVPHGRLNGVLLPAVLEFNAPACLTAYAALAKSAGIGGATERLLLRGLTAAIVRLRAALGLPGTLHEAGIPTADLDAAADALADAALADACAASNPRPATGEDLKAILRQVR